MRRFFSITLLLILLCCIATACDPDSNSTPRAPTRSVQRVTPIPDLTITITAVPTLAISEPTPTEFTFAPTNVPQPACDGAPQTRLILHERGRVTDEDPTDLNMRTAPGTDNDIVLKLRIHSVFLVLDGPVCQDDYAWYYIRYRNSEGWIAEGEQEFYYVEPYLPG